MAVPLVALKALRYAGIPYRAGQAFDARDEADARVLRMTKLAHDAPVSQPVPVVATVPPVETVPDPVTPETVGAETSEPSESPVRARRYRRKDLTSEDAG